MRQRCLNPRRPNYQYYGGRGITIDPAWDSFEQFFADMGHPPSPFSTLDRIDNNQGYSKANCAWKLPLAQMRNRRNVKLYEYEGERKTLGELAQQYGIKRLTIRKRLTLGWTMHDALTIPASFAHRPGPRNIIDREPKE